MPVGDRLTMGAAVAALACRRYFDFTTIVPIHWGTMPILDPSPDTFRDALEGDGGKVLTPEVGVAFDV